MKRAAVLTAMDCPEFKQMTLAKRLEEARRSGQQVTDAANLDMPVDVESGYRIAALVTDALGWEPLGWKIAGTTEVVRRKLGISHPIYGRTFRRFRHISPVRFDHAALLDPLVECEFFVTLSRALPPRGTPWTLPEVTAAIGTVHAGIEVAECRFPSRNLPPLPAILADGSASGRYVYGGPIANWEKGLGDVSVVLLVDGISARIGRGSDVMGDPLMPLLWLAEERRRWGDGLKAGEMISTGSCTGMLPVRAGQSVEARFGDEAHVRIAFEA
jgi:2-keto-4-pentenoate hydratase